MRTKMVMIVKVTFDIIILHIFVYSFLHIVDKIIMLSHIAFK